MTIRLKDGLAALADEFALSVGGHASPEEGMCAMELVAFLDGQAHTDRPRCTSFAIADFVRHINDNMPEDLRQGLLPYLPRLVGTASEELEPARDQYFAWQTIKVFAPAALRSQGYRGFASRLERAKYFYDAQEVSRGILAAMSEKRVVQPVGLAVHRAYRAAASASYAAKGDDDPLRFLDELSSCGYLAASAAFHSHLAGSLGIWEKIFETLEGVLSIGQPSPAEISRGSYR